MKLILLTFLLFAPVALYAQNDLATREKDRSVRITYKPRASYPPDAGCVVGTVILRIAFLASGELGAISVVKGLPNAFTESAMAAARRMKFDPAVSAGKYITVTKQVEFSFSY